MEHPASRSRNYPFGELGLKRTVEQLVAEVQALYRSEEVPWVVGYSGGKDSTAVLQLIWLALKGLEPAERRKPVHVISTDTLVENPVVAAWVTGSLQVMQEAARSQSLPIEPHRLTPTVEDSFWVNLIGRGYPAPRPMFRWCTERLKIKPSNKFIKKVIQTSGQAILVLGTRKAESAARAGRMNALEALRVRERLSPNASQPNSLVYTPIEDWSNDEVWMFLMQVDNPWGYRNQDLQSMYQGATADGECPLVVDTSSPSCGDSRFGCWVCTLVERDRSMSAMIQNDEEKEWMQPLLALRDALDLADDHHLRDFRRMAGRVELYGEGDVPIPGPYRQEAREEWLRQLLKAEAWIRRSVPPHVRKIELVSLDELAEIRRLWVEEKCEVEDNLPIIYEECHGRPYPGEERVEEPPLAREDFVTLRDCCGDNDLRYQLLRELLAVEARFRTMARRANLFDALEKAFARSGFADEDEATQEARLRKKARERAQQGENASLEDLLDELRSTPPIAPLRGRRAAKLSTSVDPAGDEGCPDPMA